MKPARERMRVRREELMGGECGRSATRGQGGPITRPADSKFPRQAGAEFRKKLAPNRALSLPQDDFSAAGLAGLDLQADFHHARERLGIMSPEDPGNPQRARRLVRDRELYRVVLIEQGYSFGEWSAVELHSPGSPR